jgi:hypothetical protein
MAFYNSDDAEEVFSPGHGQEPITNVSRQTLFQDYHYFRKQRPDLPVFDKERLLIRAMRQHALIDAIVEAIPWDKPLNEDEKHMSTPFRFERTDYIGRDLIDVKRFDKKDDYPFMTFIVSKDGLSVMGLAAGLGDVLEIARAITPLTHRNGKPFDELYPQWKDVKLPLSWAWTTERLTGVDQPSDEWVDIKLSSHGFYNMDAKDSWRRELYGMVIKHRPVAVAEPAVALVDEPMAGPIIEPMRAAVVQPVDQIQPPVVERVRMEEVTLTTVEEPSSSSGAPPIVTATTQERLSEDTELETTECVMCFVNRPSTRVEPCGHKAVCGECSERLSANPRLAGICLICQQKITEVWDVGDLM